MTCQAIFSHKNKAKKKKEKKETCFTMSPASIMKGTSRVIITHGNPKEEIAINQRYCNYHMYSDRHV